jgi:hypothetical protein
VHAIATTYLGTKFGRKRVEVNLSAPLPIDVATMHPNEVVEIMKNSFLDLGVWITSMPLAARTRHRRELHKCPVRRLRSPLESDENGWIFDVHMLTELIKVQLGPSAVF